MTATSTTAPTPARATIAVAAVLSVLAGLQYIVIETIAASAWTTPTYSYVTNFVSDLGVPACGPFEGREICSPLHTAMNTGFVLQGVLFLGAAVLLRGLLPRRAQRAFLVLSALHASGLVLVGAFHTSTAATADGTITYHYAGATLAILAGNVVAIVAGRQWRALGAPRWFGRASALLGASGLAAVIVLVATFGVLPPGVPERIAVYAYTGWQVLVGTVLLARVRRGAGHLVAVGNR